MRNEIVICRRDVLQNLNENNEEMYKMYALK